ncbi:hypothetical protein TEA_012556 [Camellia sinensis var. sinensis]|uniref:LSM domain-containing protein n=1 Tax=Camellia sinensis var. sinensis TaxID=542762 RepID=A0A4S4E771_CAMSN|nr:hypothetical protein TEA_012556 [Camellia sinensis var. sinensis]
MISKKEHIRPLYFPLKTTYWLTTKLNIRQVVTYETKEMSGTGEKGSTTTKTPADFLKSIRGRPVVVKLNSGVDYRGHHLLIEYFLNNLGGVIPWRVVEVMKLVAVPFLACPCSPLTSLHYILFWVLLSAKHLRCFWPLGILACLDGYMNIAMEQTEEKSLGFDLNNTEMGLAISSPIGPANSGFHPRAGPTVPIGPVKP